MWAGEANTSDTYPARALAEGESDPPFPKEPGLKPQLDLLVACPSGCNGIELPVPPACPMSE
jgi:hypothetical protein